MAHAAACDARQRHHDGRRDARDEDDDGDGGGDVAGRRTQRPAEQGEREGAVWHCRLRGDRDGDATVVTTRHRQRAGDVAARREEDCRDARPDVEDVRNVRVERRPDGETDEEDEESEGLAEPREDGGRRGRTARAHARPEQHRHARQQHPQLSHQQTAAMPRRRAAQPAAQPQPERRAHCKHRQTDDDSTQLYTV